MASKPRWSSDWPIPRSINLPGCRIAVRALPAKKREEHCGAWLYDHEKDVAVILIDDTAPIEAQRYTLLHELQHAIIEIVDVMLEKHSHNVKLEREVRDVAMAPGSGVLRPSGDARGTDVGAPAEPEQGAGAGADVVRVDAAPDDGGPSHIHRLRWRGRIEQSEGDTYIRSAALGVPRDQWPLAGS